MGFYALTLLSRYIKSGSQIYKGIGENNVHATMAVSPEGEVTIVAVNRKAEADTLSLEFASPIGKKLNRHLFDPNTLIPDESAAVIGIDKVIAADGGFSDELPPFSVAVYTTYND